MFPGSTSRHSFPASPVSVMRGRLAGLLLFCAPTAGNGQSALAPEPASLPMMVKMENAAQDRTAKRIAQLLLRDFQEDPRFTLVSGEQANTIILALAERVGWERRLDRTSISYQVRLSSPGADSVVIAASCWNWELNACARRIVESTAQYGSRERTR